MKLSWVIGGAVTSLVLLVILLILQGLDAPILQLETRWLALATLPAIIGLLVGGVIKRFSGFGIELEAILEAPIDRIMVAAQAAAAELPADEKRSIGYLQSITEERRREIRRLSFALGRQHYYASEVVRQYLDAFPQLEFLEIQRPDGSFDSLLPIAALRPRRDALDDEAIHNFVASLERGDLRHTYGSELITETVSANQELVHVLPRVRRARFGLLPVIDERGHLIGVITTASIEREIANAVLRARGS